MQPPSPLTYSSSAILYPQHTNANKRAVGEFFFKYPDALPALNQATATGCAEIAPVLIHLRKQLSNIADPFRPQFFFPLHGLPETQGHPVTFTDFQVSLTVFLTQAQARR